ncbi:MAG: hypothetical protein N2651_00080, partial [Fimbriimonadales bacterium]|nr:hypothetical protein [Fimbriimonadales bacterium]
RGLGDVEWLDRVQSVRDSYDRIQAEREAWGFPKLVELVGERFAHKLAEFLHIPRRADNTSQTPARPAARGGASAGLRLARAVLEQAAERFVDADGRAGLTLQRDGRTETYWVESKAFERVLLARAAEQGIVPRASVLDETRAILIGECWRDPVMRTPALRVAGQPDAAVYVDLGDDAWRVVQVDSNGWQIVPYAIALPVRFVRPYGMTALPTPQRGGDITLLRRFLRLNDEGFWLLVAWLLGCYLPDVQYPILALSGPPGSGKTFATRILRQLVDPRSVPFSALPRDAGDLWAYAMGSYLLAFDNASRIDADLSDLLCGAATEGGAELRQYHTRLERVGVRFRRPVLLNGVPSLAQKSDLADRFITLELHPIPDSERRAETALRAEWEQVYPLVLGALLSGVASAIRHWGRIQIPLPRLGDFALWAAGGLRAYGVEPAQFLEWYTGNRLGTACDLADSSALCEGVRLLLADRDEWRGTPSELLTALRERLGERRDQLPNSPRHLSSRLRMETPLLVALGIAVETGREGKARQRVVRLRKADDGGRYEILASAVASALDVNNLCLINGEADAKTGADATILNCETQKQSEETYAPAAIVSENIEFQRPSRPPAVGSANFVPDPRVFEADANLPVASASPSSVRHPDLADLLASRRDGHALVAWLWYWAESRDFPALAFDSGQRIIGCKSAWLAFLRTAELDKLERARRAAE